ncbi:MAG: hypothetical protein IJ658_09875, partial [Kiritimatiellae bacterium]|nr:hypothetical protein [Kiritimatiellia bacterium]
TRVPDVPTGLNWYYSWGVTRGSDKAGVPANVPFRKVEPTGAAYAYTGWPSTTGADNASTHQQAHYYTGYVRIPGEEGEDVTCSFISSLARYVHLRIGGTLVVDQRDNKNWITGTGVTTDYNRLTVTGPYTFKAGWQTFELYMGNSWNSSCGPLSNAALGWVANFGVGVDWQGRCVTNSANYVKFLDPGDGSFLRPTLESKAEVDPAAYPRPSFGGAVAFGPGTTFDMGDVTPYTPVTVSALSGCPAIANGELVVSNSWAVSHAQAVAQPLTVAAGAKLTFAAGTALCIDDIELFSRTSAGTPLVVAEDADAITGFPVLTGLGNKWKVEASEDGRSLVLRDVSGTVLLFR